MQNIGLSNSGLRVVTKKTQMLKIAATTLKYLLPSKPEQDMVLFPNYVFTQTFFFSFSIYEEQNHRDHTQIIFNKALK